MLGGESENWGGHTAARPGPETLLVSLLEIETSQSGPGPVLVPGRGAVDRSEQGELQKVVELCVRVFKEKSWGGGFAAAAAWLVVWEEG